MYVSKPPLSRSRSISFIYSSTSIIETIISITRFEVAVSMKTLLGRACVSLSYWCIRLASYSCSRLPDVREINPDASSLELLVAGCGLHSRFVGSRAEDPLGATKVTDVPRRLATQKKNLNIDPARFPAYAWRMPRRIKVHSVIGNGSGPLGWKIHDWIAVGTQFTRWCEHGEGGGKKVAGAIDITLIFCPWTDEDALTIRKKHDAGSWNGRFEPPSMRHCRMNRGRD